MKIIIVGGVAGGMSAATRLRRLMEDAEITIFEKGPFVSFANCGLPYYVSGEIANRDSLLVQTPESLKARFNLDVRPFHEIISISPAEHIVTVSHDGQEFTESYDKLILSPGAKPFVPAIEGLAETKNTTRFAMFPISMKLWQPWTIIQKKLSLSVQVLSGLKWLKIWRNADCKLLLWRKHPMSCRH